jgi:hypothetical protein
MKLELFSKNFALTKELSRVIKARDRFLAELKSIETSVKDKTCKAAEKEVVELYRQRQVLRLSNRSFFSKISERHFARTVEFLSLRTMCVMRHRRISIRLDVKSFYFKLADLGFYNIKRKTPLYVSKLIFLNDYEIISFYNTLIKSYLNWFRCADNFASVKNIIWTLRVSCLKTLAKKHKKNLKWALAIFTITVTTVLPSGISISLPSVHEVSQLSKKFSLKNKFQQPNPQELLNKYLLRRHFQLSSTF